MELKTLAEATGRHDIIGDSLLDINGICCDSRKCSKGSIFAAVPGVQLNGEEFCGDAIAHGAIALLTENKVDFPVAQVIVPNVRLALSRMAEKFYGEPSKKLKLIGITGTNGKTTTAFLARHILNNSGIKCGMLGTICCDDGSGSTVSDMTTPDSVDFCRYLGSMVKNGCKSAVAEISSHSLSQHRAAGSKFTSAVFTNLTRDHLDYHGDMESYGAAKSLLFCTLCSECKAVLNADDAYSKKIAEKTSAEIIWYSKNEQTDLFATVIDMSLDGSHIEFNFSGEKTALRSGLVGNHNIYNMLSAIGAAVSVGVKFKDAVKLLESFNGVPGRLERVKNSKGKNVFVDYAHTDDALRNVLSVLKPLCKGRIITVFGCGGDRDRGKRPLMAKVAEEFSDIIVVTNDNPRTEDAEQIFCDIKSGFSDAERVIFEYDRPTAISRAVNAAGKEDLVLIAGKGHEDYQVIGKEKIHMDDRELALSAIAAE